jgi:hypothetical protein
MPADMPTPVPCRAVRTILCAVLGTLALAVALGAAPAGAADAKYEGISADGQIAIFSTTDQLVPGDTDNRRDIYERSIDPGVGDYVTRQVSIGPIGGNNAFDAQHYGIDSLGATVFFSTAERLTPDDTDGETDVYMRDLVEDTTARVSRGEASCEPGCGNGSDPSSSVPAGVSADGAMVFFATSESLSPNDGDASLDIYVRDLARGATALVSRGEASCEPSGCGRGALPTFFQGTSTSGEKAFLTTAEGLVGTDVDGLVDIYERDLVTGMTRLVSVAGTCPGNLPPGQNCDPTYGGASGDGSHVFFETNDRISAQDTDSSQDVYDWSNGAAALASTGPDGGNGAVNALYAGSSPDGANAFFATGESLDASADTDAVQDVYARVGGAATELVSAGEASCQGSGCGNGDFPATLRWVSPQPSGSVVVLITAEPLSDLDRDGSQDVYLRDLATGTTALASQADSSCVTPGCGNGAFDANFARASGDGSRVFFITDEPLSPADTDANTDVYERSGGVTGLISTGAINGNGAFDAQLHGISDDGSRAYFLTRERLAVDDDFLGESDVYMRSASGTLLVSVGNDPGLVLGPPPPVLQGTDPPSPNPSTQPAIVGQATAGALIKIYTNSDCTGDIAATGTAEQLAGAGISVTVPAGSTMGFWATAEADGVTSPCSAAISYTQQDAPPPPPPPPPPDPDPSPSGGSSPGGGSAGAPKQGGLAYVTPHTRITFAPGVKTRARNPVFRFTDSTGQEGTRFFCKLDRRSWRPCGSPQRLKQLKRGKHVFKVKAVNAAGAWEPQPVKRTFKLVLG